MVTRWEYGIHTVKNPDIDGFAKTLERYGRGGWELITMTSTVKFWNRAVSPNELVLVFKRPTDEPADLSIKVINNEIDPGTGLPIDQVVQ